MLMNCITLLYLVHQSIYDVRERKISLYAAAVYTGIILMTIVVTGQDIGDLPGSLAAAGAMFVYSLLSGGALGMGDAIVIATLAFTHKPGEMLFLLFTSLMLCFPVSIVMLCRHGRKESRDLPFIPFLLAGEVIDIVVCGCCR